MKFLNSLLFLVFSVSCIYSQEFQDCKSPFVICDLASYKIDKVLGIGTEQDISTALSCTGSQTFKETNSFWIEWKVAGAGVVTFVIDPNEINDDLDFVLFRKNGTCADLDEIRCMASGAEIGTATEKSLLCKGATGLKSTSIDEFELSGCKYADDNYLKFLSAEVGETYSLLVNNYGSSNGFTISFEGTAALVPAGKCKSDKYLNDIAISSIYPNPATDIVTLIFESNDQEELELEILDFSGKKFYLRSVEVIPGTNSIELDINEIPSGSYLIKLKQGDNSTVRQFVKA